MGVQLDVLDLFSVWNAFGTFLLCGVARAPLPAHFRFGYRATHRVGWPLGPMRPESAALGITLPQLGTYLSRSPTPDLLSALPSRLSCLLHHANPRPRPSTTMLPFAESTSSPPSDSAATSQSTLRSPWNSCPSPDETWSLCCLCGSRSVSSSRQLSPSAPPQNTDATPISFRAALRISRLVKPAAQSAATWAGDTKLSFWAV